MTILRISTFSMRVALTRKKMISSRLLSGKRRFVSFPITDFQKTTRQLLTWATQAGIFCFLDNQGYPESTGPGVECLLAAGVRDSCDARAGGAFPKLKAWARDGGEWLFGHFAYDLAEETEPGQAQSPRRPDPIGFPDLFFFIPE